MSHWTSVNAMLTCKRFDLGPTWLIDDEWRRKFDLVMSEKDENKKKLMLAAFDKEDTMRRDACSLPKGSEGSLDYVWKYKGVHIFGALRDVESSDNIVVFFENLVAEHNVTSGGIVILCSYEEGPIKMKIVDGEIIKTQIPQRQRMSNG